MKVNRGNTSISDSMEDIVNKRKVFECKESSKYYIDFITSIGIEQYL